MCEHQTIEMQFLWKKNVNGTSKIKKHLGNLRGHDIVGSFDVPLIMAFEIWLIEKWGSPWILIGYFVIYCFKDFEILKFLKIRYLYLFLILEFKKTICTTWIKYYFGVQNP